MQIHLLIGPSGLSAERFRTILKKKRMNLEKIGVISPDWNHLRVYMACSASDEISIIRNLRGFKTRDAQDALYKHLMAQIGEFRDRSDVQHLVLSSGQLGALMYRKDELERLKTFASSVSDDIRVHIFVGEQTQLLIRNYSEQVMDGRRFTLERELGLARSGNWWDGALAFHEPSNPDFGLYNHLHSPPHWLDYGRMADLWGDVFGPEAVSLRAMDLEQLNSENAPRVLNDLLGIEEPLGTIDAATLDALPSAATLSRVRQFNDVLIRWMQAKDLSVPFRFWKSLTFAMSVNGPAIQPEELHEIAAFFKPLNDKLIAEHPHLDPGCLDPVTITGDAPWTEADPLRGFRATQYMAAHEYRIKSNSLDLNAREEQEEQTEQISEKASFFVPNDPPPANGASTDRSPKNEFLEMLKVNHRIVLSTQIKPHNNMGRLDETETAPPFVPMPKRDLPPGSSGRVIVGCMKNEAPYILEWVAYHRAIGVDNFLIYTNGCEDGTDEILDRLQEMGVLEHRLNNDWKGNSPQQYALNQSLKEPVIQQAEWIIHIDVDEFINVRTGDGTLDALFAEVPDATNIAMTWRLFGHNGVERLEDKFVIDQFDSCAPKYCPKPHTVWGFKTMFKNIGAYGKISCHRPNKLDEKFSDIVKWVNGSGRDITKETAERGWRNSKTTIGYDLVQLNHYALRSAESFLIKRQRGRALHVDRSIGLNYWIRMDWSDFQDVTIKRNVPRLRAEYDRLLADDELRGWHQKGLNWHRAKVEELHGTQEFEELYQQALKVKLNETERVAYALALDMES
ncbi:MAG: glycosyltransferase family 2 protein [Paracoccaceae bacterium]